MENFKYLENDFGGNAGFFVSPRLAKLNEDFVKNGGKWHTYSFDDLFDSSTGDVDLQQKDINGKGDYFINSGKTNLGIKGKTDKKARIFPENTITVDFFGNAYYRPFNYKMATHNHVFSLDGNIIKDETVGLYLVCQMNYLKKLFSYSEMGTWTAIKELPIMIPMNEKEDTDYSYMRKFIAAIELENLNEIDKLLDNENLSDCTLLSEEKEALRKIINKEIKWKRVPMGSAFIPLEAPYLRKNTRRQDHVSKTKTAEFCLPVVCAKRGDNGIMYYGRKQDFKSYSNVLSIIYNGAIAAGLVYAHEDEVGIFTDSYLIKYADDSISFDTNLFLKTAIEKKIYPIYSREMKAVWKGRVENEDIFLPVDSEGHIDTAFMETLIRAEKKLAVRGVIEYRDQLIAQVRTKSAQ